MWTLARVMLGHGLDEAALQRALALEDPDREVPFQRRVSLVVAHTHEFTGRPDLARAVLVGLREGVVARGEEGELPFVVAHLAATAWMTGDLEVAEHEATDAVRLATLIGQDLVLAALALMVRASVRGTRGDAARSRADAAEALAISERIGWWYGVNQSRWAQAVLALSEDDPQAAVAALEPILPAVEEIGVYEWLIALSLPDAIEALIATGEPERAARSPKRSLAMAARSTARGRSLSGRCRALLAAASGELDDAQAAAEQALREHERLPMPFELARTLLVLGQLQRRRASARREARFSGRSRCSKWLGAPAWADKARAEASAGSGCAMRPPS